MTQDNKVRVGLSQGADRRCNIYAALDLVRAEVEARLSGPVMIKPNFLSSTNQLASSHVEAARGVIDFLLSTANPPQEIIIAEGGNETYSGQAFANFGYAQLVEAYDRPIHLVDLNQETAWVETPIILADHSQTTVRMPKTVLDCPCTISLAIAKTHDVCVVTLALKNMIMGTIHKKDRVKMHGFLSHAERRLPAEAQVLNINLMRLARFLSPDIAVIDGTRGLQGNGPGGADGVDFGIAAASADVFAADAVVAKAMGFEPVTLGLLHYAGQLGHRSARLEHIEVVGRPIAAVARPFKPHETTPLQLQWQEAEAITFLQV
jgi:uncharacterized protein (DUF362 family)